MGVRYQKFDEKNWDILEVNCFVFERCHTVAKNRIKDYEWVSCKLFGGY